MEKTFIENLFKEKAKNDSNSEDLANTLNILSKTVFGDVNRFVFELLQNADDSPNADKNITLDVGFHLFDRHLLFYHNGTHFSELDIKSISKIGSLDSQKDKRSDKTGYKGIGFKSVFRTSDYVHIISKKYKFKFDKNFSLWVNDKSYPWQVIPIWHEEIPSPINQYINTENVNTILEINDKNEIYNEIISVFKDCQIILFLRNINSISFKVGDTVEFVITKTKIKDNIYSLFYNNEAKSNWYIEDFYVNIPFEIKQKVSLLSDEECPRKLKEADISKLTFAACLDSENKLRSLQNTIVYNYLPTKVCFDFPFIVNGDFITNAERTQLLINEWNKFLLYQLAKLQFDLLIKLNKTLYKYDILQLLITTISSQSRFYESFNMGISEAVKEKNFIPDITNSNLIKAQDALIDSLEYSSYFPPEHITSLFGSNYTIINRDLLYSEKLVDIGSKKFGKDNYKLLIESKAFQQRCLSSKDYNTQVISFLSSKIIEDPSLKKQKFILDNNRDLQAPENLYFPKEEYSSQLSFASLLFINQDIYLQLKKHSFTISWLESLDVKYPNEIEILRKSIFQLISQDRITKTISIEVTRFIFKLYLSEELTDNDYRQLRKIKFLTNNGMQKSEECYLPDRYNPALKIERLVSTQNYIKTDYINSESEIDKWRLFFLKLNVKDSIKIISYEKTERTKLISYNDSAAAYLEWIDKNDYYENIYYNYRNTGQHAVSNFRFIFFLENLRNYEFATLFWEILLKDWNIFNPSDTTTTYHYRGGQKPIPDYLFYFIRNNQSIPATDGKCYKSTDIYAPRFKDIIGNRYPVANFKDSSLTKEKSNYLGLKQFLDIDDCIGLLEILSYENINNENKEQIFHIYDEIIKSHKEGNRINRDISNLKLLTLNNQFKTLNSLHHFDVDSLIPPVNSDYFIQFSDKIKIKDKGILCQALNIPIIKYDDLTFEYISPIEEESLKKKIRDIIPYLSIVLSHKNSVLVDEQINRLHKVIINTTVYMTEEMSLCYKTEGEDIIYESGITIWHENSSFYFSGNWKSPLNMYSLSSLLCGYFDIENIEKELSLFLQISISEIKSWLLEKGYNITEDIIELNDDTLDFTDVNEDEDIDKGIDIETSLSHEIFTPEVQAKEADVKTIKVETIIPETINYREMTTHYQDIKDEAKIDVGRWSEEYIYSYLQSLNIYSSITWLNESIESYLPYDFIVVENEIEVFIEVKGTTSTNKTEFYMSKNEWAFMFEKSESYKIYRLINVGKKENVTLKIIEDPSSCIIKGDLIPDTISLHI